MRSSIAARCSGASWQLYYLCCRTHFSVSACKRYDATMDARWRKGIIDSLIAAQPFPRSVVADDDDGPPPSCALPLSPHIVAEILTKIEVEEMRGKRSPAARTRSLARRRRLLKWPLTSFTTRVDGHAHDSATKTAGVANDAASEGEGVGALWKRERRTGVSLFQQRRRTSVFLGKGDESEGGGRRTPLKYETATHAFCV